MISHYDVLGVPADADAKTIQKAYHRKARTVHPDVTGEESDLFLLIKTAYDELSDSRTRAAYDARLAGAEHVPPSGKASANYASQAGDDGAASSAAGDAPTGQGTWSSASFADEHGFVAGMAARAQKREEAKRKREARAAAAAADDALRASGPWKLRSRLVWVSALVGVLVGMKLHATDTIESFTSWAETHGYGPPIPMVEDASVATATFSLSVVTMLGWRLGYAIRRRQVNDPAWLVALVPLTVTAALVATNEPLTLIYKDLGGYIGAAVAVWWMFPKLFPGLGRLVKRGVVAAFSRPATATPGPDATA